ncbi:MAG: flavin reductase family protein [Gemmatimonadota bacterium]|jgi:flavin reductase (DIM6/NTAB) family NADH-FMN oxidoreductase RutF
MPEQNHFRHVMGHFTTGVTVVTSRGPDGSPCGLTANSLASVSLDPALVLVCLDRSSVTRNCILDSGSFSVCVLRAGTETLAERFASGDRETRFDDLSVSQGVSGSPILDDALAWIDCAVEAVHEGGDHSIVVGRVMACDAREGSPLVFFRGDFHGIGT